MVVNVPAPHGTARQGFGGETTSPEYNMRRLSITTTASLRAIVAIAAIASPSGHAAAQADDPVAKVERCAEGFLWRATIDGNLTVDGSSCHVFDSVILGKVTVTNSPTFALLNTSVIGKVTITGGTDPDTDTDAVINNSFVSGSIVINKINGTTLVADVRVRGNDNVTIKNSNEVMVFNNFVPSGNLKCAGNAEVFAAANEVPNGKDTCSD
jgi:hypothetical protein